MPLSMTTEGREVGSMGIEEENEDKTVVGELTKDLRRRSNRGFKGEAHGREGRLEKRKREGELVMVMRVELDPE